MSNKYSVDDRMAKALREIIDWNEMDTEVDAYLYDVAKWGLGEREKFPDHNNYGLWIVQR